MADPTTGFTPAPAAIARMAALSTVDELPSPPRSLDTPAELRGFLVAVASHPVLSEAIAVSSDGLAAMLAKVADPRRDIPLKRLRRAVLSVTRYLDRGTGRPTPFGLMAGVAAVRFDSELKVRVGTAHRKRVAPDMEWFTGLLRGWEQDPAVLRGLRVTVNDLCQIRGDRLVLPFVCDDDRPSGADDRERSVRYGDAVRLVLELTASPRSVADLVRRLTAEFPGEDEAAAERVVRDLVALDILLTDLRPPSDVDPLQHVAAVLDRSPASEPSRAVARIAALLANYETLPVGAGTERWGATIAALREHRSGARPVKVDLALDAEFVLPDFVAQEFAAAADAAWRALPTAFAPIDRLAEYRAEFVARYGYGALVPVKELVDPHRGIGAPSGYLLPPAPQRRTSGAKATDARRDHVLLGLAQQAYADGRREVELTDELLDAIAGPGDRATGPRHPIEMCAQLLARTENDLRAGDFRLVVSPLSYTLPGGMFGRFLGLLPALAETVAASAGQAEATTAQLDSALVRSRYANLTQVPHLLECRIAAGVHADRSDPAVLGLDDLAVTADRDRFAVLSLRTGDEVVPLALHGLNPSVSMPNAMRLLADIGEVHSPAWPLWHWGAAGSMPYLPRVRRGRTVLCPARWLPAPDLVRPSTSWPDWEQALQRWRAAWHVPDVVQATCADHRLRLDLTSAVDRRILFDDLRRKPDTVLHEVPADGSGWACGHTTEIVVPLRPVKPAPRPALSRPARQTAWAGPSARPAHLPAGPWVSLRLYAEPARHDDLLVHDLPILLAAGGDRIARWFFLRYHDDRAHLRLRMRCRDSADRGALLSTVHDWTDKLVAAGLVGGAVLDTYRPEVVRYGGPGAIDAAEAAFQADSTAVLDQLAALTSGTLALPRELLVAANHVDMLSHLVGTGWAEHLVEHHRKDVFHAAFQHHRRDALRFIDPGSGWAELAQHPGGQALLDAWRRRTPVLRRYGELLRDRVTAGDPTAPAAACSALLHMHHNRLTGTDRAAELAAGAVARGVARTMIERAGR